MAAAALRASGRRRLCTQNTAAAFHDDAAAISTFRRGSIGILGGLTFGMKVVMEPLPNIEPVSLAVELHGGTAATLSPDLGLTGCGKNEASTQFPGAGFICGKA